MLDKLDLNTKAQELRELLGEDANSPVDIFSLANQIDGLTLVFYPLGENIGGMCIRDNIIKLIAINLTMSYGRQRFSLAHELYHLYFDDESGFNVCSKRLDPKSENEKCADQFASYFLAPYKSLRTAIKKTAANSQLAIQHVIALEQYFGMSHLAMILRSAWRKMIREEMQLTEKYFFDTDCLSAFLWVREESILARLYAGRIILPAQVYHELQKVPHLLARVDMLKNNGYLSAESMEAGSEEYNDYLKMTTAPEAGMRIIGRGEAAGIAMAKRRNGTLANNNLRDIRPYVEKYEISHITTGDILVKAMNAGMITEAEGNVIWLDMIRKRRMLPTMTFSEYLANYHCPATQKS